MALTFSAGVSLGVPWVFHRLCACQVFHVEEVDAHLTCDFAVTEQHGDVQDGASGEESEGSGAGLDATELLEVTQFCTCQDSILARFQLVTVILHESADGLHGDVEVRRHHRRRHMHPVRQ